VLYICIPSYNEAETIGVLLWRIRTVFQDYSREYEVLVHDDGSTDSTAEKLEPYTKALPLTVLGDGKNRGYAAAMDSLFREASARTKYPRRDAIITMQGDFTDQPEHLPELIKRFEGGADLVVAERPAAALRPQPVRTLRRVAPWVTRPFVSLPEGVTDPFGSLRLYRVAVVRDMLKKAEDSSLTSSKGWAVNLELLLRAAPFARRVETLSLDPRYDIRSRASRIRPFPDALDLYRYGWAARSRRQPASTG
jgi:glycosyltransferase involved in cell wall biosynthesis